MSILDSINKAKLRGASDDQILLEYLKQNPSKKSTVDTALQRGANASSVINEIIRQNQNSSTPKTQQKSFGTEVIKGVAKGAAESGIGLARMLGTVGTATLGAVTPGISVSEALSRRQQSRGIFSGLVSGTPEAQRQTELLKATNMAQFSGKILEFIGEMVLTSGTSQVTRAETKLATQLNKASLRVTGANLRNFGEKVVTDSAEVLTKYKIVGNPAQRTEKIKQIYKTFEKIIQDVFDKEGGKVSIPKQEVLDALKGLKESFVGKRFRTSYENQVDDAIKEINRLSDKIPIKTLNIFKRSTSEAAFNKLGTQVSDLVEEGIRKEITPILEKYADRAGLEFDGKTLHMFNTEYSKVINTRKLLKLAEGRPEIGMLVKILAYTTGGGIGYGAGGPLGSIVGVTTASQLAKVLGGTAAKSGAASILETLSLAGRRVGRAIDFVNPVR